MRFKFSVVIAITILVVAAAQTQAESMPAAKSSTQGNAKIAQTLDATGEKRALQVFRTVVETKIVQLAQAIPADKYNYAPTEGEFKSVRTFGQQLKHLAATNHMLAAAAVGEEPPSDAGDEAGPDSVRTKAEILEYVNASFAQLGRAIDRIGEAGGAVKHSPISPLKLGMETRMALSTEALIHAMDHYGQMVEYARMNGVIPPSSQ